MRRRPNICDFCALRQSRKEGREFVSFCSAFPDRIPKEIELGGFDHRWAFEGDRGIQFESLDGKAPTAFDNRAKGKLRYAKLFDALGPGNKPIVDRPAVPAGDVEPLLAALKAAPVVLSARGYSEDLVDPSQPKLVPLNYRTDGTWVWGGATAYHLEKHGIPPEADLVDHLRSRNWTIPEVHDSVQAAATSVITEGPIMGPPQGRMPAPYRPPRQAPQVSADAADAALAFLDAPVPPPPAPAPAPWPPQQAPPPPPDLWSPPPVQAASPAQATPPGAAVPAVRPAPRAVRGSAPVAQAPGAWVPRGGGEGLAEAERLARQGVVMGRAARKLAEYGAPEHLYKFGAAAVEGWSLVREEGMWMVFWSERGGRSSTAVFDVLEDAAMYMVGQVIFLGPFR